MFGVKGRRREILRGRLCAGVVTLALVWFQDAVGAERTSLDCTVVDASPAGIYVDAGRDRGVDTGDRGVILRRGGPIADVEVVEVTGSSALLRLVSPDATALPEVGDRVQLVVDAGPAGDRPDDRVQADASRRSTLLESREEAKPFVPLLAPPDARSVGLSEASDLFHGRVWVHQLFQVESEKSQDFAITRVGTAGTYERIGGTRWTLEWSGDVSYRTGQALQGVRDYQRVLVHARRVSMFRRVGKEGFLRFGRFLPTELPAAGYIDGLQAETALGRHFRVGVVGGLKPTRTRLELSVREPTVVPYVTVEAGVPDDLYYSGTAGLLASLYDGRPDRLSFLLDQTLRVSSPLSVTSTSAVDFDVGGAETRSGTRLTRIDLFGTYSVAPLLHLRAGFDHYERPDTQAERDLLPFIDPGFFDDGYWRYFVGASHDLPWRLRLSEEIAWIDSDTVGGTFHWSIGLTKLDLPGLSGSSASVRAYNLDGQAAKGIGGRLSINVPLFEGKLSIAPSVAARVLDVEGDSEQFELADVSVVIHWAVSDSLSVHAGVARAFGTEIGAFLFDLGLSFRW